MIPDIIDEPEPIDFTWFYFIGKKKLNLSFHETGRLTLKMFGILYKHYKDDWDLEMKLRRSETTYHQAYLQAQKDEEWL